MAVALGRKIVNPKGFAIGFSRAPLLCTLILLPMLLLTGRAEAQGNLFVVRGVPVDVTAGSAVDAREQAIAAGHREALHRLFRRLVPLDEMALIPTISLQEVFALTQDFSVENERTSGVRYIADFNARFRGDDVQAFLRRNGVRFAVTRSKPVLVLPVWSDDSQSTIWFDSPWYEFWLGYVNDYGLVPLMTPLGDLQDISSVEVRDALALDPTVLQPLAERYDADDVIVSHAKIQGSPEFGLASLTVSSWQFSAGGSAELTETFGQREGEDLEGLLRRGAESLDAQIQEAWKLGNLIEFGDLRSIYVSAYTPDLGSWLEVRSRLKGVSTVDDVRILALSKAGTSLDISFAGTDYQLALAMKQNDLRLSLNADGEWELSLAEVETPFPDKATVAGSRDFGAEEHETVDPLEGGQGPAPETIQLPPADAPPSP